MKFHEYNSLENAYREKFVDQCRSLGIRDWIALEKVHGSNMSFIVDYQNKTVTPAKRSSTIGKNPEGRYDFMGCHEVVEKYTTALLAIAEYVGRSVQVYGELYGQGIQKEIDYGQKDFIVFDIMDSDGEFLPHDTVVHLCHIGLPVVPELGRGSLEEMLSIDREFTSLVASGDNQIAEGLVIKPLLQDVYLNSGSRAIIKNKSQKFSEKKNKAPKKPYKMPEEVKPLYEDFLQYLNKNRLINVLSKVEYVSQRDFGRVQGMLVQDAKEEFERDEYVINKDHWKLIAKSVGKSASEVVREDWLNIIDSYSQERT